MKRIEIKKSAWDCTLEVYGPGDCIQDKRHGDSIVIEQRSCQKARIVLYRKEALALARHILRECGEDKR